MSWSSESFAFLTKTELIFAVTTNPSSTLSESASSSERIKSETCSVILNL